MPTKKTTKTTKTNTTKTAKASKKPEAMTYPQVRALTNALFHSNYTKAKLSEMIDKRNTDNKGRGMSPEAKAKWLSEHGEEPATFGQCKMYAMCLFNGKCSHEEVSKIISNLDKKNGYKPTPKEEKASSKEEKKDEVPASLLAEASKANQASAQ